MGPDRALELDVPFRPRRHGRPGTVWSPPIALRRWTRRHDLPRGGTCTKPEPAAQAPRRLVGGDSAGRYARSPTSRAHHVPTVSTIAHCYPAPKFAPSAPLRRQRRMSSDVRDASGHVASIGHKVRAHPRSRRSSCPARTRANVRHGQTPTPSEPHRRYARTGGRVRRNRDNQNHSVTT